MMACHKCRRAFRRIGNLNLHARFCGHDSAARFWSRVDKGDGCWPWIGAKHRDGYGRANVVKNGHNRIRIAHRIAWEFTFGDIPTDKDVCHTCDNRICCKPDHLYLGTHQENMTDMARKGRAGTAKLTTEQVIQVKELLGTMPQTEIAKRFGVSGSVICNVKAGRNYRHVK